MKLFFTASIHGKKKYSAHYQKIVQEVEKQGHKIKADHLLETTGGTRLSPEQNSKFLARVINEIKRSDAVFAELSYNSTSTGYIVSLAVSLGKPVAIFFSGDEEPQLFAALESTNDKLAVARYSNVDDLEQEVPLMLDFVAEAQDTRFNFFVSPPIAAYLDWVAKNRRVPRAVFLRKLMDEDMKNDKEYQSSSN